MRRQSIPCCRILLLVLAGLTGLVAGETRRGFIVCIGTDALESVSEDWKKPGTVIQGVETSTEKVVDLRTRISKTGSYGKVSVIEFDGKNLPYIDNLASHVIAGGGCKVPKEEILRVLAPYGSAKIGGETITKPFPEEMDEWPQYLHGADNNCVASDTRVGPPRHVQWISGPAWTRAHEGAASVASMVSAGGRLFSIVDTASAEGALLPAKWKLIAQSAFNGVELWSKPYPVWEPLTVYVKSTHTQAQRQMVATADTLYCKPGRNAPVVALNAATGETIREYPGTGKAQEIVLHDGLLFLVVGDRMHFSKDRGSEPPRPVAAGGDSGKKNNKKKKKGGQDKTAQADKSARAKGPVIAQEDAEGKAFQGHGFAREHYSPPIENAPNPTCRIVALDPESGREIWRSEDIGFYTACSLCMKGDKLVYQSTGGVFCLDAKSGTRRWAVEKEISYGLAEHPHTVVLSDEAVYSEEGSELHAYALSDGSAYWKSPLPFGKRKGYEASSDVLIANGALWVCGDKETPASYDLKTGELIKTIPQALSKPMGHDRCFRNYITERFFINSKTGGPDCLDLEAGTEHPAPFTRATCSLGPLPCNGLIYCGPYSCQCHLPAALHNFNVYYTNEESLGQPGRTIPVESAVRLVKGPAFGSGGESTEYPWPTYRQDARRYAGTTERLPGKGLKQAWRTRLSAPVTPSVLAEGKVFVAETDTHTLHALDAGNGEPAWSYVAGGRIDSPPTCTGGLLLFGSRDGWVHCVRASDGVLAWRFRDLPDKLICVYDQVESAWPVHGSILIRNGTAYFCAGRSSFLDGGLFLYGLDVATGAVVHRRQFYGPYGEDGLPKFVDGAKGAESEVMKGTTGDVMSSDEGKLYIRQHAFTPDLQDTEPGIHLLASAGFLESQRQHREYALVKPTFNHRKSWTFYDEQYPTGDIIVSDGKDYFSVFGSPVTRPFKFNPVRQGYHLTARTRDGENWSLKWDLRIGFTGRAMAVAGDTLFVAGTPLRTRFEDVEKAFEGRGSGLLRAVSAEDGSTIADYEFDTAPSWDSMAIGYGKLIMSLRDGSVICFSGD